ncbi:MAG TPA: MFS transporter [Methylomirabilota bacterium]|nr:MFS transporter [Methylomirabilota bacterium]
MSGEPTTPGGRLGALAEPQFRLLWIGQTASAAGDALIFVAVAFAVLQVGGSAADLGIVFAAFTVSNVALVLAGGVWADRLPRQSVMVVCDVVRAIAEVVMAILLLSGTAQVWHIAVGAATIGGASAFFGPASQGLIPQTVSAGRLQQANALIGLSRNSTRIFGPPISGLLIAFSSTGVVFLIDSVTFLISAVSLLMLRPTPAPPRPTEPQPFLAELAAGWREVTARPWIVAAICTFAISNLAAAPFLILGPVVAEQHLGGAAAWGFVLTGGGIGGVIGGLLALRWRPSRPLMSGFMVMGAVSLPPLALIAPLPIVLIAASSLLSVVAIELANTWWFTMLQQHVPDHARSRVSSYDWLVSLVFQPLGFLLAGPLAAWIGLTATLVGAAVIGLLANYGVLLVRAVRDVRWVSEVEAAA